VSDQQGGLYIIRLSAKHFYGGRAVNFSKRWQQHLSALLSGDHPNPYMQSVFNLHGEFDPEVLEVLPPEAQISAEQAWLDENLDHPGCVNLNPYASGGIQSGLCWVSRGPEAKRVLEEDLPEHLSKGWGVGRPKEHTIAGYLAVHKGSLCKKVPPEALQSYIDKGWKEGVPGWHKGLVWLRKGDKRKRVQPSKVPAHVKKGWVVGLGSLSARYWIHLKEGSGVKGRKRVREEEVASYLGLGWSLGSAMPNTSGLLWVHKDGAQRRILEEDIDVFFDQGWELGQPSFRWMKKAEEYKQVPLPETEGLLSKGWSYGYRPHTEEEKDAIRGAWTEEMRAAARDRILQNPPPQPSKEARKRAGRKLSAQRKGVQLSEEHKRKLSEAQAQRWAKVGGHTEEAKQSISEKARRRFEEHPELWAATPEKRQKNSEASKGRIWINNGERNRFLKPEAAQPFLDSGWVPGKKGKKPKAPVNENRSKAKRGRVWVNDGQGSSKMVSREAAETLLAQGWVRGRGVSNGSCTS
jgi:hypothetical protein